MSNENKEQAIEKAKSNLTKREAHAYTIWCGTEDAPLSPALNAKLFNLFLQGKSTEEIRRLNQTLKLGAIVAARIEGRWDERREEHLDQLLSSTMQRVQQATLETADFVCDLLAVANREHGDKLRKYLQSGDESELGEFRINNLTSLKTTIEALQKLTGQERQTNVKVSGEVLHRPDSSDRTITASEAGSALKLLLGRSASEN